MKKMFLVLVLLMFASQAVAGTVTLTLVQDGNDLEARIADLYYSADANVSGFGLNITVEHAEANIIDLSNYFVGECNSTAKGFGIFPDNFSTYIDAGNPDWSDSNYTPVAPNTAPGASGSGLGMGTIIVEMGALYEDGNQPPLSGLLCKIQVDGDCNVTVTGDATRGNVVLEDSNEATLIVTAANDVPIRGGWVYPDCWGYSGTDYLTQCHGDYENTDGLHIVNTTDFGPYRDGFDSAFTDGDNSRYIANACADGNRDGYISTTDFGPYRDNFDTYPPKDCNDLDYNEIFKP